MESVLERINKIFRTVFDNEKLVVTEETSADDIEGWDSLQHINILAMLEKEFQVELGHADFYRGLAEEAGMDEDTQEQLRDLIENKNSEALEKQNLKIFLK